MSLVVDYKLFMKNMFLERKEKTDALLDRNKYTYINIFTLNNNSYYKLYLMFFPWDL